MVGIGAEGSPRRTVPIEPSDGGRRVDEKDSPIYLEVLRGMTGLDNRASYLSGDQKLSDRDFLYEAGVL